MQPQILIIGAGKSASVLIQFLQKKAVQNNWYIVLADGNFELANQKWNNAQNGHTISFDIDDNVIRGKHIENATIVVSMLPATLHIKIAHDCLRLSKPLFTASYVDENMKAIAPLISDKKLLFLCEMGLDPGIDHMSAMELIHRIQKKGGTITSFKSHCGGLIAPESDNNPWHYKISWNPRNIILAGKSGAIFLQDGEKKELAYEQLFNMAPTIEFPDYGTLAYYPNRNSLSYIDTYSLNGIYNFVRTTLRHPEFCSGWNALIQLGLTSEEPLNFKGNETICEWFNNHLSENNLQTTYQQLLNENTTHSQLAFLGFEDATIIPSQHNESNATILQWILEQKWKLSPTDKDLVVMMHEIQYERHNKIHFVKSSLLLRGENTVKTAMAKTVGLPLALAVCAYLKGEINLIGLHIPTHPIIYEPILKALASEGIYFMESHS